jgi:anti-sigma factor RsiW
MNETHPSIEQIVDYLHGELSPAQDAVIYAHLAGCLPCSERRTDELAIGEALRAHARAGERNLPASLVARIRSEIERPARDSAWEQLRTRFRPIFVLPAAAAAAAILYAGIEAWQSAATTPIDAADYVDSHAAMAAVTPFADDMPQAMLASEDEAR